MTGKHRHDNQEFDINAVNQHLQKAIEDAGQINHYSLKDVNLQEYVLAYRELNKMFPLFGRIFTFVQSDVEDKEQILQNYIDDATKDYSTVWSMCLLEVTNNTAKSTHPPSASRTFLRLHRALIFIIELVKGIKNAQNSDHMSTIGRESYDRTLAQHHGWLVQKGVHLGVRLLPNRNQLIYKLAGRDHDHHHEDDLPQEAFVHMENLVQHATLVYEACQAILEHHQCTDLP